MIWPRRTLTVLLFVVAGTAFAVAGLSAFKLSAFKVKSLELGLEQTTDAAVRKPASAGTATAAVAPEAPVSPEQHGFSMRAETLSARALERAGTAQVASVLADAGSRELLQPGSIGPVEVNWKMILVPEESPDREVVVTGTMEAPDGTAPDQEITMYVYHREAPEGADAETAPTVDIRPRWLPSNMVDELGSIKPPPLSRTRTRIASQIQYYISGPGYEERGFEIDLVRGGDNIGAAGL